MKKQKFNKKLSLNKETITNLNEIKGGGGEKISQPGSHCAGSCFVQCITVSCTPTKCEIQISQYQGESGCQAC